MGIEGPHCTTLLGAGLPGLRIIQATGLMTSLLWKSERFKTCAIGR